MNDELIARLHDHARNVGGDPSYERLYGSEANDIADALAQQAARIAGLETETEGYRLALTEQLEVRQQNDARIAALERNVRGWVDWHRRCDADDDCNYLNDNAWCDAEALASTGMGLLARAALQSEERTDG